MCDTKTLGNNETRWEMHGGVLMQNYTKFSFLGWYFYLFAHTGQNIV